RADEFFAVFERAAAAAEAAVAIQRELGARAWTDDLAEVRVRVGIHSGRPTLTDLGYIGLAVHTTARVCSAAHGGQIVVSAAACAGDAGDGDDSRRRPGRPHGGLDDPRDGAGRAGLDADVPARRPHDGRLRDLRAPSTGDAGRRVVQGRVRARRGRRPKAPVPGRGAQPAGAHRRGYAAADDRAPRQPGDYTDR